MGLFSNRLDRECLKPGDHIYSWRAAYIYAHHGIYIGDDKVIHFTRRGKEVGTESVLDAIVVSSAPPFIACPDCQNTRTSNEVIISCVNCFLAGGFLYLFEYSVSPAVFLANLRAGTCSQAASDPPETVNYRATYLLNNQGFGDYDTLKNNCEDFAIYCKTGSIVGNKKSIDLTELVRLIKPKGQVPSAVGPVTTILARTFGNVITKSIYVDVALGVVVHYANSYVNDVGLRSDATEISVEDLVKNRFK